MFSKTFDIILDLSRKYEEFCHNAIVELHNFLYLRQKTWRFLFNFGWYGCVQILEADLLQVAKVMGRDDEIDVTNDIGTADAILASGSEMKQNPWIRSVAKFHHLPVFVIKVYPDCFFPF
jgi:hypothetical protein